MISKSEINQLVLSIEKLLDYLLPFTKIDLRVRVIYNDQTIDEFIVRHSNSIRISPLLFNRIDGCHGAGKCCMVPFDLVYTKHCMQRVVEFNPDNWSEYGDESVKKFINYREHLLANHEIVTVCCEQIRGDWRNTFPLYVKRNTEINHYSSKKSCPYLFNADERFYCGVHPFKPLHCWMPHMTIRSNNLRSHSRPEVIISRLQYGRNHKFGCPVKFDDHDCVHPKYLELQAKEDFNKFKRISNMLLSTGFTFMDNYGVGLFDDFDKVIKYLKFQISPMLPVLLWEPGNLENHCHGI